MSFVAEALKDIGLVWAVASVADLEHSATGVGVVEAIEVDALSAVGDHEPAEDEHAGRTRLVRHAGDAHFHRLVGLLVEGQDRAIPVVGLQEVERDVDVAGVGAILRDLGLHGHVGLLVCNVAFELVSTILVPRTRQRIIAYLSLFVKWKRWII